LPGVPSVLCHSDLHAANVVAGEGGLKLLDWEYAHLTEAFWDLAAWSCNNDLAGEPRRLLLLSYLGRTPRDEETERLGHLAWLYDYVCLLWSELFAARGGSEARAVSARARLLAERLYVARL
jgi:thiamine kinase-like enzyme